MHVSVQNRKEFIDLSVSMALTTQEKPKPIFKAAKIGFQQMFYQKNNQLVVKYLGGWEKSYSIKKFNLNKESNEKGIKQFKSLYSSEQQQMNKKRRRLHSIDTEYLGYYHLNNWLSNDEMLCEKAASEQKSAALIYEILFMRWEKAIEIITTIQKSTEIAALHYILKGFKTIHHLLNQDEKTLTDYFLARNCHQINFKQSSSDSVGGYFNFINILEEQSRSKFIEIRNIPRKAEIVKINLQYLIKFASNFKPQISDDYIKLAFKILGNEIDQEEQNIKQEKDYLKCLLNLDLKLTDRLNFAMKLLNEKKRRKMCNALEQKLTQFPSLDNILFYNHPINKQKEKKIEDICKLYLDKYGDLQTIAYLSYQFSFLQPYLKQFKQALQMSYEHKELERLEMYRCNYEKEGLREEEYKKYFHNPGCFFDYVNTAEEKILDWKATKEKGVVCQLCCKIISKADNFLICGKCKHGGHISHLLKWFNEHENCPHIGCPCFCN